MHLIFASPIVPCGAPESGFVFANRAISEAMQRAGVRVTHIGYKLPGTKLEDLENTVCLGEIDLAADTASALQKIKCFVTAIKDRRTYTSVKLRVMSDADFAKALGAIGEVDGIVLSGPTLAGAFENTLTAKPYIYIAYGLEHISASASAKETSGAFEKIMYRREAKHLEKLEKRLAAGSDFVITLADEDRAPLGVDDDSRSLSLPLVTSQTSCFSENRAKGFDVGMVGAWNLAPKRVGLEWMLQEVMPHLPQGIIVAIAGDIPKGFPQRDKRIQFLGRVLDEKDFLRQCRVIALTSQEGSSMHLETIETFEMGLPAVATPASIRTIAHLPSNVLVANDPKLFAQNLADHVLNVRTNLVHDIDGSSFRTAQLKQMDSVIEQALAKLDAQRTHKN